DVCSKGTAIVRVCMPEKCIFGRRGDPIFLLRKNKMGAKEAAALEDASAAALVTTLWLALLEGEPQSVLQFASGMHRAGLAKTDRLGSAGDHVVGWAARLSAWSATLHRRRSAAAKYGARRSKARAFEVGALKVCVIEEVEEVHAELDPVFLLHIPVLRQLGVHVGGWHVVAGATGRQVRREGSDCVSNQRKVVGIQNLVPVPAGVAAY